MATESSLPESALPPGSVGRAGPWTLATAAAR